MPAWMTSPNRRASGREPCIAIFRRARRSLRRFIGPRSKSWPLRNGTLPRPCRRLKHCEPGCCCSLTTSRRRQIIAPALNTLIGDPKKVFEASYTQMWEAIRALVKRAVKSGDIRKDLDPIDLLRALIGVANVSSSPDWQQSARRLVEILILGARPLK